MKILILWLLYSLFGTTVFALAFLWAVRARQFQNNEHARRLPLLAKEPWAPVAAPAVPARRTSLVAAVVIVVVIYASFLAALWILSSARGR